MASISADKLRHEIQSILRDADLNTLSSKKVRQMLESIFKCDFTERKKEIDDILMSEITTRDITPIPINAKPIPMGNDETQVKQMSTQPNNEQMEKSGEEVPMETHQQENRPSIRTTSASSIIHKHLTTPSLKIERRRTTYNKELDISDQLAVVVGGHRVNIRLVSDFFCILIFRCLDQKLLKVCGIILKNIIYW
jgi:chromatin remodeling complex protein RSC6